MCAFGYMYNQIVCHWTKKNHIYLKLNKIFLFMIKHARFFEEKERARWGHITRFFLSGYSNLLPKYPIM